MILAPVPFPDPRLSEAFQDLRVRIELAWRERSFKALLLTSPSDLGQSAGVAAFLGAALARSGRRVVLVSADLHRPEVEALFGIAPRPGLTEAVTEELNLSTVLHRTWIPNLEVLPAGGSGAADPAEVLASPWIAQVLKEAREYADLVVVHGPPVLAGAEAALLASHCDAAVLVLEAQRTTAAEAAAAKAELEKVGQERFFLGAVMTNTSERRSPRRPRKGRPGGFRGRRADRSWEAGFSPPDRPRTEQSLGGEMPPSDEARVPRRGLPPPGTSDEIGAPDEAPARTPIPSDDLRAVHKSLGQLAGDEDPPVIVKREVPRRSVQDQESPTPRQPEVRRPSVSEKRSTSLADAWVFKQR